MNFILIFKIFLLFFTNGTFEGIAREAHPAAGQLAGEWVECDFLFG